MQDTYDHTPALTGLRALAAGWIFAFHLWRVCGAPAMPLFGIDFSPLLAGGHYGVDLFFVLSGFLLARPFIVARLQGRAAPAWGPFLARRARRVLPAYWLQLSVLVAIAGVGSVGMIELLTHVTLTFNVIDNGSRINAVYWTLPVEWDFYLLLPLLALALPAAGRWPWLLAGLAAFALAFRVWCWSTLSWDTPSYQVLRMMTQLPARIDQFAIGMAVAWWLAARPMPPAWLRKLAPVAGLLLLLAVAWNTVLHGDVFDATRLPWAYVQAPLAALGCAGMILGAATPGDGLNRLWRWPPVVFVGTVSYSLYLWHTPVLDALAPHFAATPWRLVALTVTAALVVAWLSWRFVEQPFQRRRRPGRVAQTT